MATLEESLVLHDKFTRTMEKADQVTQKILGTFEQLHNTMSKDFNFNPTINTKGLGKMNTPAMDLDFQSDQAFKNLSSLINETDNLEKELNDVAVALADAFSQNNTRGIQTLQKEYQQLYEELAKVESKAVSAGEKLANIEVKKAKLSGGATGINDPPQTRVAMLEARLNSQPALSAFEQLKSKIMNTNLNPFKDMGKHGQREFISIQSSVDSLKSKISGIQSNVAGVASNISNSLSNAFNKVPLVNRLTTSIDSLKQRLSSAETSSVILGNSFARGAHEGQKLSIIDNVLQKIGSSADNLARKLLGVKNNQEQLNQSMSRVAKNASHYTKIGSTLELLKSKMKGFTNSLKGSEQGGNKLYAILSKIPQPITKAIGLAGKLKSSLLGASQSGGALSRVANLMTFQVAIQALRTMSNLMSGLTDKADNYIQTMNRLNIANDGNESIDQFNDKIMASAIRSRTAYGEVSETVARLAINAKDAFSNNDEAITFAENLNKLYKISGATLAEQQGSMIQLTQAMARGVLRGEELNSVWEQGPLIIQKIADYLGVTQGELKAMADEGEITADIVKSALLSATDEINAQFNTMDMTFGQMVQNFKTYAIGAFQPLIESWNAFVNSVVGQQIFEGLVQALFMVAYAADWAFNQILVPAITWVTQNIEILKTALIVLSTVAVIAASIWIAAWLAANWPLVLIVAGIAMIIYALNAMGLTAAQVGGFIAYVAVFIATAFWDAAMFIAGIISALVVGMINSFVYFANAIISVAEFFYNVWRNPVYSIKKLFFNAINNILSYWGSFVSGTSSAAQALGDMFVAGVNIAIKAVNGLISLLNKIPGVNIGSIGAVSVGGGSVGGGYTAPQLSAGAEPDDYVSFGKFSYGSPADAADFAWSKMASPTQNAMQAYTATENLLSGVGSGFGDFMDRMSASNASQADFNKGLENLYNPDNSGAGNGGGGSGGKGGSGSGKKPKTNVGTVDKIKDEVDISDEDLKYLRDVAERNFVLKYEKIEPSATVNYKSSGDTKEDAKRLLAMMEQMIVDQSAQGLYT